MMKEKIRKIQRAVGVDADGIVGPQTVAAILEALNVPDEAWAWPSQADVRAGKSVFGAPGDVGALVSVQPPYELFYEGKAVRTIRVHRLIAPVVLEVLEEVLAHYGRERIRELGLDQYGGSYNYRPTTNGKSLSMHAWGIALDFCPVGNEYERRAPQATLSRPECRRWWEIWESFGAVSMGRCRGFDWMHVQFARI